MEDNPIVVDGTGSKVVHSKGYSLGYFIGSFFLGVVLLLLILYWQLGIFEMAKPVIYLYPTVAGQVKVTLVTPGSITVSDPPYNGAWNVLATPEGRIDGAYDYLFYEADVGRGADLSEGWIVEGEKIGEWFDLNLPVFGLNENEEKDFMEYWMVHLPKADYYKVVLLSDEDLDEMVRLDIEPKPDTIIRVNLYIKPINEKIVIPHPRIKEKQREGFTVVEWGVILDD
ncbi:MAG: hypothetical protein PHG85_00320 [Candidatus Altiarchaeota archaeon]|nr:hypothetical protein [Candidatus Altiarchaeota archaeon]